MLGSKIKPSALSLLSVADSILVNAISEGLSQAHFLFLFYVLERKQIREKILLVPVVIFRDTNQKKKIMLKHQPKKKLLSTLMLNGNVNVHKYINNTEH